MFINVTTAIKLGSTLIRKMYKGALLVYKRAVEVIYNMDTFATEEVDVLGNELVKNNSFSNGTTDWTIYYNAGFSVTNGVATITGSGEAYPGIYQSITSTGKYEHHWEIVVDEVIPGVGTPTMRATIGAVWKSLNFTTAGTYTLVVPADNAYILEILTGAWGTGTIKISNISVKEIVSPKGTRLVDNAGSEGATADGVLHGSNHIYLDGATQKISIPVHEYGTELLGTNSIVGTAGAGATINTQSTNSITFDCTAVVANYPRVQINLLSGTPCLVGDIFKIEFDITVDSGLSDITAGYMSNTGLWSDIIYTVNGSTKHVVRYLSASPATITSILMYFNTTNSMPTTFTVHNFSFKKVTNRGNLADALVFDAASRSNISRYNKELLISLDHGNATYWTVQGSCIYNPTTGFVDSDGVVNTWSLLSTTANLANVIPKLARKSLVMYVEVTNYVSGTLVLYSYSTSQMYVSANGVYKYHIKGTNEISGYAFATSSFIGSFRVLGVREEESITGVFEVYDSFSNLALLSSNSTAGDITALNANPEDIARMVNGVATVGTYSFGLANIQAFYPGNEGVGSLQYVQNASVLPTVYIDDDFSGALNFWNYDKASLSIGGGQVTVTCALDGNYMAAYNYPSPIPVSSLSYIEVDVASLTAPLTVYHKDTTYIGVINTAGKHTFLVETNNLYTMSLFLIYSNGIVGDTFVLNSLKVSTFPYTKITNYTTTCRTTLVNTNYGPSNFFYDRDAIGRLIGMLAQEPNTLTFNGDGRYIDTKYIATSTEDVLVEIVFDDVQPRLGVSENIFGVYSATGSQNFTLGLLNTGELSVQVGTVAGSIGTSAGGRMMVTFGYVGGNKKTWLNGVAVDNLPTTFTSTIASLLIGKQANNATVNFDDKLGRVRIIKGQEAVDYDGVVAFNEAKSMYPDQLALDISYDMTIGGN